MNKVIIEFQFFEQIVAILKKRGFDISFNGVTKLEEVLQISERIIVDYNEVISKTSETSQEYNTRNELWNKIINNYKSEIISGIMVEARHRGSRIIEPEDIMYSVKNVCPVWPFCKPEDITDGR